MAEGEHPDILELFRTAELQRRATRRQVMLNYTELDKEPPAPEDPVIYSRLKKQQLVYERNTSPGYWRRLWSALLNK